MIRVPRLCFLPLSLVALLAGPAAALVVTTEPLSVPPDPRLQSALDALGRWGNNAGAVAVADGWVLTTRHQDVLDSPPNRTVVFDGTQYTALAGNPEDVIIFQENTDLRLVRVVDASGDPADFSSTLRVSSTPVTVGTALQLAGFGRFRGDFNQDGFDYAGTRTNNNGRRHGTNEVSEVGPIEGDPDTPPGQYEGMAAIAAIFDDARDGTFPPTEATVASGDSGGFWLVGDAVEGYRIAGLTHGVVPRTAVDLDPETLEPNNPASEAFFGQVLVATDATPFASTINAIPEPAGAAVLGAGLTLLTRRRRG